MDNTEKIIQHILAFPVGKWNKSSEVIAGSKTNIYQQRNGNYTYKVHSGINNFGCLSAKHADCAGGINSPVGFTRIAIDKRIDDLLTEIRKIEDARIERNKKTFIENLAASINEKTS